MIAIDLFAGMGGFTTAARAAGVRVAWAANHWREAVNIHAANHPETAHACQDLQQANWELVPRMDLLLASPACQGHSKARGVDRPHHDATRSTAWAVVSCAEFHRPAFAVVENVPEFRDWALFPSWCDAWARLGYAISVNVFDAADAGVPQNRLRCFVVASRSRHALAIKSPTIPHRAAAELVEWSAGKWSAVHRPGRAAKTLERVEHGRREFGERFTFSYYGNTRTSRSLARPIGTITTRDRWAVVDGDRMRMLMPRECLAAMGFPTTYILPENGRLAVHMIGNAVPPPLAAHVISEVRRAA